MMINQKPSGAAKAGLTTGIIGTSLGAINMLGAGANLLGNRCGNIPCNGFSNMPYNVCCDSDDRLVDRYTLNLEAKLAEKDTQIALRDANTFTDQKFIELYKYFEGELRGVRDALCKQEVENQKTSDSFQIVSERMQCCCDKLEEKIENECRERQCSDNTIVNYMNATFYPKMVADVTTGTTTTAQVLFNPLPASKRNKC